MARRGSYAKGIAKREEILTTALEVIARNGYRRTSVRELADAASLSQAGLLHYFSSKEELFAEILRKRDEVDTELYGTGPEGSGLQAMVQVVRHNSEVPGLVQLYSQLLIEAVAPEHPAHEFFTERLEGFRSELSAEISRGQEEGEIRGDIDPSMVANLLLATADGLQAQWLMDPTIDMAAHVEAFLGLLGISITQ